MVFRQTLLAATAALGLACASNAGAAGVSNGATVDIRHPFTVTIKNGLNFGNLVVTGAGTGTISPATGTMALTGAISSSTGSQPARLSAQSNRTALIWITIPPAAVTLQRVGGTETITADNFQMNIARLQLIGTTPLDFAIGARLNIPAGIVEGSYTGQFPVTIDYF